MIYTQIMFLINLVKKLNQNKLPYALVGGHAVNYQQTPIRIISKKDLIQMKKQSGRQQDLLDIEALEKL